VIMCHQNMIKVHLTVLILKYILGKCGRKVYTRLVTELKNFPWHFAIIVISIQSGLEIR